MQQWPVHWVGWECKEPGVARAGSGQDRGYECADITGAGDVPPAHEPVTGPPLLQRLRYLGTGHPVPGQRLHVGVVVLLDGRPWQSADVELSLGGAPVGREAVVEVAEHLRLVQWQELVGTAVI